MTSSRNPYLLATAQRPQVKIEARYHPSFRQRGLSLSPRGVERIGPIRQEDAALAEDGRGPTVIIKCPGKNGISQRYNQSAQSAIISDHYDTSRSFAARLRSATVATSGFPISRLAESIQRAVFATCRNPASAASSACTGISSYPSA